MFYHLIVFLFKKVNFFSKNNQEFLFTIKKLNNLSLSFYYIVVEIIYNPITLHLLSSNMNKSEVNRILRIKK